MLIIQFSSIGIVATMTTEIEQVCTERVAFFVHVYYTFRRLNIIAKFITIILLSQSGPVGDTMCCKQHPVMLGLVHGPRIAYFFPVIISSL